MMVLALLFCSLMPDFHGLMRTEMYACEALGAM